MIRLTISKAERRAMGDALRDMKRGGARPIDLRRLPVGAGMIKTALYGVRPC